MQSFRPRPGNNAAAKRKQVCIFFILIVPSSQKKISSAKLQSTLALTLFKQDSSVFDTLQLCSYTLIRERDKPSLTPPLLHFHQRRLTAPPPP